MGSGTTGCMYSVASSLAGKPTLGTGALIVCWLSGSSDGHASGAPVLTGAIFVVCSEAVPAGLTGGIALVLSASYGTALPVALSLN